MNYDNYSEFPFPTKLDTKELQLKKFFFSLSDEEQLKLLSGSRSYNIFCDRLQSHSQYKTYAK